MTIARGTHGCTPEQNVAGMHWSAGCAGSDPFDAAAFFAFDGPGLRVVTIARVPRSALIYYTADCAPYEVLIEDVPIRYEVVTDRLRITRGAVRFSYHLKSLGSSRSEGFDWSATDGIANELTEWWEGWHRANKFNPAAALYDDDYDPDAGLLTRTANEERSRHKLITGGTIGA